MVQFPHILLEVPICKLTITSTENDTIATNWQLVWVPLYKEPEDKSSALHLHKSLFVQEQLRSRKYPRKFFQRFQKAFTMGRGMFVDWNAYYEHRVKEMETCLIALSATPLVKKRVSFADWETNYKQQCRNRNLADLSNTSAKVFIP